MLVANVLNNNPFANWIVNSAEDCNLYSLLAISDLNTSDNGFCCAEPLGFDVVGDVQVDPSGINPVYFKPEKCLGWEKSPCKILEYWGCVLTTPAVKALW